MFGCMYVSLYDIHDVFFCMQSKRIISKYVLSVQSVKASRLNAVSNQIENPKTPEAETLWSPNFLLNDPEPLLV